MSYRVEGGGHVFAKMKGVKGITYAQHTNT